MSTAEPAPHPHGRAAPHGSKVRSRSRASSPHPRTGRRAAPPTGSWSKVAAPEHQHRGPPQGFRTDATERASEAHEIRYSHAAWLDPSPCPKTSPNAWNTEESTPCALSIKIEPDSRGTRLGMTSKLSFGRDTSTQCR